MSELEEKVFKFMQENPRITFEDVGIMFKLTREEVLDIAIKYKLWG